MMLKVILLSVIVITVGILVSQWMDINGYGQGGHVVTKINDTYDYIVVGAGSAGSVVAARLSKNPNVRVLLVEAGGEEIGDPSFHIPGMFHSAIFTEHDWQYPNEKQEQSLQAMPDGDREITNAGRIMGGGSILNFMQYMRGSKYDFNSWEEQGCDGWSYEKVLPYFLKSEDIQVESLKHSKYHSTEGFLGVSEVLDHPMIEDILQAGIDIGYKTLDLNGESDRGFMRLQRTVKNGVRSTPVRDLLRPAMLRPNLHVAVHSFVTKVIIKNKKATGIKLIRNGLKTTVNAEKEVILSSGAVGSAKLLLLSGIGPKDNLHENGIPVIADLPVGRNYQNHVFVPIWTDTNDTELTLPQVSSLDMFRYLLFKSGTYAFNAAIAAAYIKFDESLNNAPDVQIDFSPFRFPPSIRTEELLTKANGPGFTFAIFLSNPRSRGYIKLRSTDPFDLPVIDPQYLTEQTDVDKLVSAVRVVEKLMQTDSFKKYNMSIELNRLAACAHEKFDTDNYWECFVRHLGGSVWHFSGSCKMGPLNDKNTVVDPRLRVKGIQNLRVIDASIMPTIVSGNINAPTIMIAEKGADMILKDIKEKTGY